MSSEARTPRSIEELIGRVVVIALFIAAVLFACLVVAAGVIAVLGGLDCECWRDTWIQEGLF